MVKGPIRPQALAAYLQHPSTRGLPLLGLDVGGSKVGVAVSDASRQFAAALTRIDRRPPPTPRSDFPRHFARELSDIIKRHRACALVVGYPLMLWTDQEGSRCEEVATFMQQAYLSGLVPLPYVLWDERMTTQEARETLWENKRMGKTRQQKAEDQVAATIILQSFLSSGVLSPPESSER